MLRKLADYIRRLYCLAVYAVIYNYCAIIHDPMTWGRHASPIPRQCHSCGYIGLEKWFNHGYKAVSPYRDDVEPCDYCPRCGADDNNIGGIV